MSRVLKFCYLRFVTIFVPLLRRRAAVFVVKVHRKPYVEPVKCTDRDRSQFNYLSVCRISVFLRY